MTVLKCKMCGGALELKPGETVAECPYCGTKQTVPNLDDDKKAQLFERANRLRAACMFDRALAAYESIITAFPEEPEAYWGELLCKYGIEYVDDPATGKKIPTCHRSSYDSIIDDEAYEFVMEYADQNAKEVYRAEAKQIESIRRGINEISSKEEPYDVFICYKETDENGERTEDSVLAQDIYNALTREGYRVFFARITLEDKLGKEYEPYIFAALNTAKVMLVVGTESDRLNAVWVKNEWSRYLMLMTSDPDKTLIPCYKGITAYDLPKEFQRLQSQDLAKIGAVQDLVRGIGKLIPKNKPSVVYAEQMVHPANAGELRKLGEMALEDGNWEKAKEYYNRCLLSNAEDAEAYFGLAGAELNARNDQEFAERLAVAGKKPEIISLPPVSDEEKEAVVKKYSTPGGLSKEDILSTLEDTVSYESFVSFFDNQKKALDAYFEEDINIKKAIRFGDTKLKEKIQGIYEHAVEAIGEKRSQSIQDESIARSDALKHQQELYAQTLKRVEEAYNTALKKAAKAKRRKKTIGLLAALVLLAAGAAVLVYTVIIPSSHYKKGISLREEGKWDEAIAEFREAGQYKDSADQIKETIFQQAISYRDAGDSATAKAYLAQIRGYAPAEEYISNDAELYYSLSSEFGTTVLFGSFEQDGDLTNGKEPIEWSIVSADGSDVLLVSKYGLDVIEYNNDAGNSTWGNSYLRNYLNGEFLSGSFSGEEADAMTITENSNETSYHSETRSEEKVFLLSPSEVETYLQPNDKQCTATQYAIQKDAKVTTDGRCIWWSRIPKKGIDSEGSVTNVLSTTVGICMRPAVWINLKSLKELGTLQ